MARDAKRDPDTMDTFVDSSWYYFRFLNPNFSEGIFDKSIADNWIPVDMYVGGAEHATMHLLYARFIHKFLRDIGLANRDEPFLEPDSPGNNYKCWCKDVKVQRKCC